MYKNFLSDGLFDEIIIDFKKCSDENSLSQDDLRIVAFSLLKKSLHSECINLFLRHQDKDGFLNPWMVEVKFNALFNAEGPDAAFEFAFSVLDRFMGALSSSFFYSLSDKLYAAGRASDSFDVEAKRISNARSRLGSKKIIGLQLFKKHDTLQLVLDGLLSNNFSDYDLLIVQDSWRGAKNEAVTRADHFKAAELIHSNMRKLEDSFASVEFIQLPLNHGPTAVCKYIIDHSFKSHDYLVFLEDDVIFSNSARGWFDFGKSQMELDDSIFAVCAESIFFNDKLNSGTVDDHSKLIQLANQLNLNDMFHFISFIHSSCFSILKDRFSEFSHVRGISRGDIFASELMRLKKGRCLAPIVSRAIDVGMLNDRGFSVEHHGHSGVSEVKNYYLKSETLSAKYLSCAYSDDDLYKVFNLFKTVTLQKIR